MHYLLVPSYFSAAGREFTKEFGFQPNNNNNNNDNNGVDSNETASINRDTHINQTNN